MRCTEVKSRAEACCCELGNGVQINRRMHSKSTRSLSSKTNVFPGPYRSVDSKLTYRELGRRLESPNPRIWASRYYQLENQGSRDWPCSSLLQWAGVDAVLGVLSAAPWGSTLVKPGKNFLLLNTNFPYKKILFVAIFWLWKWKFSMGNICKTAKVNKNLWASYQPGSPCLLLYKVWCFLPYECFGLLLLQLEIKKIADIENSE